MGKIGLILVVAAMISALPARAQERAAAVDHYVLALSWSPAWCNDDPDRRDAEQCAPDRPRRFIVHGLWPQHARGHPEHCRSDRRDPTRAETAAMADLMGSGGLAWHAWRKHGRCTGMTASHYFAATRRAAAAIRIPPLLRDLSAPARISPQTIEDAFAASNPGLSDAGMITSCRRDSFHEIKLCLSTALSPLDCPGERKDDCKAKKMLVLSPSN